MGEKTTRDIIIESADLLFYQRGFEHTSFTDIADVVKISRGNFYYHFKTKDEILCAVIKVRMEQTQKMLDQWECKQVTPFGRIGCFIDLLSFNQEKIMRYGCPVGSLCNELTKLNHASKDRANALFILFRNWLAKQFSLMKCKENADIHAMHLLARSQGIAILLNALQDENFIRQEVQQLHAWLDSLSV